jgi:hypothetical protein
MIDFNHFLNMLKTDLTVIGNEFGRDYLDDILSDGTDFAIRRKENLERRAILLAEGKLTADEFNWLLRSDKNLLEMKAIKKRGLALVQMNKMQDAILGAVSGAFLKSLKL